MPVEKNVFVLEWLGVALAPIGFVLETVADQQKLHVKRRHKIGYGDERFVGPTHNVFSICRHANFLGEIIVWTGIWIAGVPSYYASSKSPAWIISTI